MDILDAFFVLPKTSGATAVVAKTDSNGNSKLEQVLNSGAVTWQIHPFPSGGALVAELLLELNREFTTPRGELNWPGPVPKLPQVLR